MPGFKRLKKVKIGSLIFALSVITVVLKTSFYFIFHRPGFICHLL